VDITFGTKVEIPGRKRLREETTTTTTTIALITQIFSTNFRTHTNPSAN
jgi:hypothetical protein